jgi:dTDP-4-dehydrorhamnose 3,5-epimerase-like enzyme
MQNLNKFEDERGTLVPLDLSEIPFTPKRIFYVTNVPKGEWRGGHAHHTTKQVLICIKGKILVRLVGTDGEVEFVLDENQSCLVDNLIWDSQKFLDEGSVLLAICSTNYDKSDYILDYNEFLSIVKGKN